jgi:hypothetical protein
MENLLFYEKKRQVTLQNHVGLNFIKSKENLYIPIWMHYFKSTSDMQYICPLNSLL